MQHSRTLVGSLIDSLVGTYRRDAKSVSSKDLEVLRDDLLVGRRQLEWDRAQQALRVDLGALLQRFKVELLVRRMLIDDEEIVVQTRQYEAEIELPDLLSPSAHPVRERERDPSRSL